MRRLVFPIILLALLTSSAKELRDTVWTRQGDRIILTYTVTSDNGQMTIDFPRPYIKPSSTSALNKACNGELGRLKVVVFDRIGSFADTKWNGGINPEAFMVPIGLTYDATADGFYILGESQPIEFRKQTGNNVEVKLPMYIAVYEKKRTYRIVDVGTAPLTVSSANTGAVRKAQSDRQSTVAERIAITSSEEIEADNTDVLRALSSIALVKELLAKETELPFSRTLEVEIYNLRALKNQIKDAEVVNKINDVLIQYTDRERELKEVQNQLALAAKVQEQALLQQQKEEADAQQKAAEEKARQQEEKQQKRTLWMIICGGILAIVGFIANAVFKHFRDIRNQRSIMEMQESLARQAEHEAGRRSREIVRNKAHQIANKGKSQLRTAMNNNAQTGRSQQTKRNKPRSI